jgi:hypothetical protein
MVWIEWNGIDSFDFHSYGLVLDSVLETLRTTGRELCTEDYSEACPLFQMIKNQKIL